MISRLISSLRVQAMQQQPCFAFGSFQDKMAKRNQKRQEEEFIKEMNLLANKPTYNMIDYKQRINDTLAKMSSGLKAMISQVDNETKASLTQQRRILNAMYDSELQAAEPLSAQHKQEIAQVAQCELEDINRLINSFQYFRNLHLFLRRLRESGEELPRDSEELKVKYQNDPLAHKFAMDKRKRKARYSRQQQKRRVKWGVPAYLYEQEQ